MNMLQHSISSPAAWSAAEIRSKEDVSVRFDEVHVAEIEQHLRQALAAGVGLDKLERSHFELPRTAALLADVREQLRSGRGIVILQGLDVGRFSVPELEMIYWGLGTHWGTGLSQSVLGDRVGHVRDFSAADPHARAYRNRQELTPHTDFADLVGLLCVKASRNGGMSVVTSALTVHNQLLQRYPQHLPVLYEGFHYHRMGEHAEGEAPVTPHRIPVFSWLDGELSCRYVRSYIETAARESGAPLTAAQTEALNCLERLTYEFAFEFYMAPGDIYLINNYTVLHARSAFEDWEEEERKRLLLRLWLTAEDWRSVDPRFEIYPGAVRGGIRPLPGRRPSYAGATGSSRMAT